LLKVEGGGDSGAAGHCSNFLKVKKEKEKEKEKDSH